VPGNVLRAPYSINTLATYLHSVCLARARLAIGEDGSVISLSKLSLVRVVVLMKMMITSRGTCRTESMMGSAVARNTSSCALFQSNTYDPIHCGSVQLMNRLLQIYVTRSKVNGFGSSLLSASGLRNVTCGRAREREREPVYQPQSFHVIKQLKSQDSPPLSFCQSRQCAADCPPLLSSTWDGI
jgi:hypothetical protein